MKDIKAYINYDAIPSKGYKHQVEVTIDDEVVSYVSVMDDSAETIQKVLNQYSIYYNNRLIAEFMEFPKQSDAVDDRTTAYYIGNIIKANNINNQNEDDVFHPDDMMFHSSWDWLMPVAEKIYDVGSFDNELVLLIRDSVAELNLKNTFESIIDYLKNQNNEMKDKNKITLDELKEKLIQYYEVDLNNCEMSNEMWIDELTKCMLCDGYKESFLEQYEEYKQLRCE